MCGRNSPIIISGLHFFFNHWMLNSNEVASLLPHLLFVMRVRFKNHTITISFKTENGIYFPYNGSAFVFNMFICSSREYIWTMYMIKYKSYCFSISDLVFLIFR